MSYSMTDTPASMAGKVFVETFDLILIKASSLQLKFSHIVMTISSIGGCCCALGHMRLIIELTSSHHSFISLSSLCEGKDIRFIHFQHSTV